MQTIAVFGSTGSIGTQTLDVIRRNPDRYRVGYLTTNGNTELLGTQIDEFHPDAVIVCDACAASVARKLYGDRTEVLEGEEALSGIASRSDVDIVVASLVGFAGLVPTVEALKAGKRVALANKETMVVAGEMMRALAGEYGAEIIPVDSEHSAIFQCLAGENVGEVERIILTASGGPFRELPSEEFGGITPERALKHPNWSMGRKITIDSATLMNKGLELIEARWLFDVPTEKLSAVIHPQSVIHSMVQFVDGSVKAQLGLPDMRLPIQYALSYPARIPNDFGRADFPGLGTLTFSEPDASRFPCLRLATEALATGGTAPAILNAANEIAVSAFLENRIGFMDIPRLIEEALSRSVIVHDPTLEQIIESDRQTREELAMQVQ